MLDNELLALVTTQLQAAITMGGWDIGLTVMQKGQPTQEGIPSNPTIFFEKLFDEEIGWAQVREQLGTTAFTSTEQQFVATHIQVSALVIQDPMDTSRPTASDVANYMRQYMSSRYFRSILKPYGANTFKINEVRNPFFEDDRHRMEAFPSFDVAITHNRAISFQVPAIYTAVPEIIRGL